MSNPAAAAQPDSIDDVIERIGLGRFQWRLLGINGLVWAADGMEVLIIGFAIPSLMQGMALTRGEAALVGSVFFLGMLVGHDRIKRLFAVPLAAEGEVARTERIVDCFLRAFAK